jgi:hypothetical protein
VTDLVVRQICRGTGAVTCLVCRRTFAGPATFERHISGRRRNPYRSPACVRVFEQAHFAELARANDEYGYRVHVVWRHQCRVCHQPFYAPGRYTLVCGRFACLQELTRRARAKRSESRRAKVCRHCHEPFTAARKDGAYCSSACRQAAYRLRRAA